MEEILKNMMKKQYKKKKHNPLWVATITHYFL